MVTLETASIKDWDSFHTESTKAFGFPAFYGRNLNAWIDCLTYLTEGDGMSCFTLGPAEVLSIVLADYERFAATQPAICRALRESVAAVNQRYVAAGDIARLVLVPG